MAELSVESESDPIRTLLTGAAPGQQPLNAASGSCVRSGTLEDLSGTFLGRGLKGKVCPRVDLK